jgi:DNA polymerase-1
MTIVKTEELTPAVLAGLSEADSHQIYCGLDTMVTFEVFEALGELLVVAPDADDAEWPLLYSFERALQAPALAMMQRGFAIDGFERARGIAATRGELTVVREQLDTLADAVWDVRLNPNSPKQLKEFFYSRMRLPEVWQSQRGERKLSLNREALEKLDLYLHARPIIALILEARDLTKRLSVLETEVSRDGRMRTSYNIGGTNTGRWSSSSDVTGTGTNLQNITPELRRMFVADPGYKLCGIDLEQAESREVGWLCGTLFGDWRYLDACEGGDLHTTTARLIWPGLGWTGGKADRDIAERNFYREFSYRDMSKKGAHGSNYLGTPWTMARHLKVPVALMESFHEKYFTAFPAIARWHRWVAEQIQRHGVLTTPFGRRRQFFGRPDDDATLRKAIAFGPQSSTGDRLNLGLWRIWKHVPEVELLAQVHDALYVQYREGTDEVELIPRLLHLVEVELSCEQRSFVIPGEAKIGWNWAARDTGEKFDKDGKQRWRFDDGNPDGLMKWNLTKHDARKRSPGGRDRILG